MGINVSSSRLLKARNIPDGIRHQEAGKGTSTQDIGGVAEGNGVV